jgi:hypothetical protein
MNLNLARVNEEDGESTLIARRVCIFSFSFFFFKGVGCRMWGGVLFFFLYISLRCA